MIFHPKKQDKKDISGSLSSMSITDVLLMNDLYYRYSKTKTVNKYFEQQRKVYDMMKLYQETDDKILINKITRLCFVQTNTVILSTLRDRQIMELMLDILLTGDNFKIGNVTAILYQVSKTFRESLYKGFEDIPDFFSRIIYRFDKLSIYQMFNLFYEDKETPVGSFSFIYYWLYAFSQSSHFPASITRPLLSHEIMQNLNPDILDIYQDNVNYIKLIEENTFSLINFFRTLSLLCKKSAENPEFKPFQEVLCLASQILFSPFHTICKPCSSQRGTIKDDCVSALIELFLNLPRDIHVYYNCIDILRNHFYGSHLTISAIRYITNNIKNAAMNTFDFELFSISVPFRLYYINEDYLYFTNIDDPVKTRLIDETKPNNITMKAGLDYIKSLIRTSGTKLAQTKKNLINSVLVLWYNSVNCVLIKSDAKLVQTFLLRICICIGDELQNETYHKLYQQIAVPFFKSLISDYDAEVIQKNDKSYYKTVFFSSSDLSSIKTPQATLKKDDQFNTEFTKLWNEFEFELDRQQTSFFDKMIEELDQLLKDSSFNFETDFQFPSEEEEEED
ncbi:hypothetical protein M9Y10_009972 [Tritrichomonas musculus]|uniref:Uncharacterized protein n=1 Tax=Tritrichomonas musculus TaxID=1915356 RepID=A0ABR2IQS1_9EUKA